MCRWMESSLVHGEGDRYGEPYRLEPWMKGVVYRLYEYDPDTLKRFVRRAVIGVAKGNAKTEFAAALALAETIGPVVPTVHGPGFRESPNVPIGAASREQANLCYGAARTMVEQGPLAPFFDTYEYDMRLKDRPGRIYRIAAEAGTNDGTLPTAFVADEVHEWIGRKKRVHLVVGNSLAKRANGLEINISTAGDPDSSELLFNLYEYGKKVQAGEIVDPSFLFVWFEPSKEYDLSHPDQLRAAIREANPSSWMDPERVAQRLEVDRIPEGEYRRYHLNQWVTFGEQWLPAGVWEACELDRTVQPQEPVALAFDGSYNGDSTALIGCTLDGHIFEVGIWERPEMVSEWKVPRSEIDAAVERAFTVYDVKRLVCDRALWAPYIEDWVERFGDQRVLEYPQTRTRMVPATSRFYHAAVAGELSHDGSTIIARHVANATVKEVPGGYVLRKDHPNRKIDAAIASVMAYDTAVTYNERTPASAAFFSLDDWDTT